MIRASGPDGASRTVAAAVSSDIIPADRLYDWGAYCGVPGGIPDRTLTYVTLSPGATAAQVKDAIAHCPEGQVVRLSAGIYHLGTIIISAASPCTLRGDGPGRTIVIGSLSIDSGNIPTSADSWTSPAAVASGTTKGSMAITLSAPPGSSYAVGDLIQITQNDDSNLVWHREGNWAGTKNLRFTTRIAGIRGNTIQLATPIPYPYTAALSPICLAAATRIRLFGIENLTILGSAPVTMSCADRCWLRDIEISGFENAGITVWGSSQCEIRRCYFHDAAGFPGSDGYFVHLQYGNSCCRVEDNIAFRTGQMIINSGSACFVGYNYATDQRRTSHKWVEVAFDSNHGPHSFMNLWEGNVGQRYQNDGYHGSGSHQILFRNNLHGVSPVGYTQERQLIDLSRGSYYESVVGNVLGHSSWTPHAYEAPASGADHKRGYIYVLGWGTPDSGLPTEAVPWANWTDALPDAKVEATLLRHANYDYYNRATVYQSGLSHAIPPSLCYAAKPPYFGSLQWPPIGPDVSGLVTAIPAQARWTAYQNSGSLIDLFR
jgi:hypothetical protein